jgi:hypothetical protein
MTVLPASARFVVPASTAAASKLVLFDVMDTIVADPFFRGFHKVAHAPRPDATKPRTQAAKQPQAALGNQAASPHRQPS